MTVLLILAVGLLSFANGANDNFKGVATLRGAGLTNYRRAIAWATGFTFLGSLTAWECTCGEVQRGKTSRQRSYQPPSVSHRHLSCAGHPQPNAKRGQKSCV